MAAPLLALEAVTKRFGGILALDGVPSRLEPRPFGLIGSNGLGKTTLLNIVNGSCAPTAAPFFGKGKTRWAGAPRRWRQSG